MKRLSLFVFFLLLTSAGWSEVSPIALTFFGIYGEPVYPPVLAVPVSDGFGFDVLAEWNATSYTSLGLGFEQISFRGGPTVPMMNFESRLFPLENEKGKFSPYIYGGAGLNLSNGAWEGPVQLKAGIGSRVSIAWPVYLDVAVGSHWLQSPGDFQYVDIRYGLSLSFGPKPEKQNEKPSATPTSAPTVLTTPVTTPLANPTVHWTPMETPVFSETKSAPETIEMAAEPQTLTIESAPVTTLAQAKKYYRLGMDAFGQGNHPLALKLLNKSLWVREHHKAPYFYAETYATLGVIYQFHAHKVPNHDQKALAYYKKALAIDPHTKSAKAYYKKLKAKVAAESKKKHKSKKKSKPAPAPTDTAVSGTSGISSSAP